MDGPPPQEEDFTLIPISDRITHKNWKARVNAYESLIKTFQSTASDTDPAFRPYINNYDLLKKIAADSNAVAQEKGLECLVALVKFAGETAARSRDAVVPVLVEKCFGSSRAGTKNQAVELVLQYVEVENGGAGVVTGILPGLDAKQPKAVAGCIFALREVVRLFGTQTTPTPPLLKALPKIFAHNDKTVRAEGTLLTRTLYNYLGPGIEPWLAELKPVQVKELKEAFENMEKEGQGKGSLKPERLTRAGAREAEEQVAIGSESLADQADEDLAPPDPRMFAEPVDITTKLPPNLQSLLLSSKWKERKEVLDELLTLLSGTPRIKDASELGELARSLAVRIQGDANINCVMTAASCMEALAKGMSSSFSRFRESVVPHMLERLKERKSNVTSVIGEALDAVFATTTLPDIVSDILPAIASKNPQAKEGALKFLGRCLSTATMPIQSTQIKTLSEPLVALLEDGSEAARNEAATCLGILIKMVGERPMNAALDGLADVRKAKVKEASEKATVKCKLGAGGPPKATAMDSVAKKVPIKAKTAQATPTGVVYDDEVPSQPKPAAKPPAKLVKKRANPAAPSSAPTAAAAKKPAAVIPGSSKASKGVAQPSMLDTFKYKHTPEDSELLATELIPTSFLTGLADSNWKARLAALEEMITWIESTIEELDAEVVVRALAKRSWSEKNFQVSAKVYGILTILAERCPSFGRSCPALCVSHLSEKLGDLKLKKPAGDTLFAFAERTSLQFVLCQAYEPLSKQKAPKVLADAVTWINSALTEFGIAGLSLRALIEFLKTALQNSNAAVRTSATKALVTLKLFAGSDIRGFLEDLNPQLLSTINGEFDKVEGTPAPEPSRTSADLAAMVVPSTSGKSVALGGDPMDDLFPRVEIDSLLKGTTILADAKSESWKTKKDALEALQAILDQGANKRLKPTMGEIGQVLKSRVTDINKAVQTLALDIVSRIATGMGKPFEKQTRFFVLPVATVLADQKATIRIAACQTLTAIATACSGVESMIHGLTTALETPNPVQKSTLLHWIADWFKDHAPSPLLDLSNWAAPIVSSLDDRNGDVRKGAQGLLPILILCAGFDYVLQQTNSLKPASRTSAVPIIQAARLAVPAVASVPPPAKPSTVSATSAPTPAARPESPTDPVLPSAKVVPPSKLTGVRRKLPQGTSRPESRSETPSEPSSRLPLQPGTTGLKPPVSGITKDQLLPFTSMNVEAKKARLAKDGSRWINEGGSTRKDLAEILQHQMEPSASKELVSRLFSHDHNAVNDHIHGLTTVAELYSRAETGHEVEEIRLICLANFDLPLKYVSIKAHEPQPNLISKCLEVSEAVLGFLRSVEYQLTDAEALCFIPTMIYKLGDAREQVRVRVQQMVQALPKVYAYSRVFQLLLDYGLKSKVAKTRQGALDEMAGLLKRSGMGACDPNKALPAMAAMIADKDGQVRKSALAAISEAYAFVGEKVWTLVGTLSPKDQTQLEERLRRVAGPSSPGKPGALLPPSRITRLPARPNSPAGPKVGGIPRPASPSVAAISKPVRSASPYKPDVPMSSNIARSISPAPTSPTPDTAVPLSPTGIARPRTMLPSRLGRPRSNLSQFPSTAPPQPNPIVPDRPPSRSVNGRPPSRAPKLTDEVTQLDRTASTQPNGSDDITITISSILSSDPVRSVEALKQIQKILSVGPEAGPSSPQYRELAEHTEGLIETITLQMAHVFERPDELVPDDNFRLAKHLIQTLNNFCDHSFLAESLTVDILTSLLEELTLRLLETDDSHVKKVKDLSRFINMIILRLFATGRRMSIFRALFALLLQILKPFPSNGTLPESKEAKGAELVLKCVWKLARNIPQDLTEHNLDPVELFPAIEHFLQSVPPNEWRARATNKVPCGDMPLRTIKVIIQHVVAHYGDEVYDFLSGAFDDPSATIVYPYVYRILNSSARAGADAPAKRNGVSHESTVRPISRASSRPISPHERERAESVASIGNRPYAQSHRTSPSTSSLNGNGQFSPPIQEPDPDAQLLSIIGHISSETTGAMHKEGITELHHFLKAYPHKRPRVEKMLESTGPAFRKYITRALASRAAEDQERDVAVADTLSKLESDPRDAPLASPVSSRFDASPRRSKTQDKLNRLHDIFHYRSSTISNGSSLGGQTAPSATSPPPGPSPS